MDITAVAPHAAAAKPAKTAQTRTPGASPVTTKAQPASPIRHFRVALGVDQASKRVVATIINPETGEVVDQMPPEKLRHIAAAIRRMLAPPVENIV